MKRILFALVIMTALGMSCADMFREPFYVRVDNRSDKAIDASFAVSFVNVQPGECTNFIDAGEISTAGTSKYAIIISEHGVSYNYNFGEYEARGGREYTIVFIGPSLNQYHAYITSNDR
jgi:hypothetical protein